jgi:hypothetical protein
MLEVRMPSDPLHPDDAAHISNLNRWEAQEYVLSDILGEIDAEADRFLEDSDIRIGLLSARDIVKARLVRVSDQVAKVRDELRAAPQRRRDFYAFTERANKHGIAFTHPEGKKDWDELRDVELLSVSIVKEPLTPNLRITKVDGKELRE